MAKDKAAGAEPAKGDVRPNMRDIDVLQDQAKRTMTIGDWVIAELLVVIARELRLLRLGVRS